MHTKFRNLWPLCVFTFFTVLKSQAVEIVWTNSNGGNWSTAANWSPNQAPSASDNAFITNNGTYTVTINANTAVNSVTVGGGSGTQSLALSSGTLTLNAASTVAANGSLTFSSGTLGGSGDVTITGTFNWSSGIMTGAGRTIMAVGTTASFTGAGPKGLNRTLDNNGTITYGSTALIFGYTAAVPGVTDHALGSSGPQPETQVGSLHLSESKKNAQSEGAVIVFEDEASFRQTPTLHATWSRRGLQPKVPTRGERHTQKIFGAVRLDTAQFIYLHQLDYFQWETYLAFVDRVLIPAFYRRGHRVYLIQDNASYHKKRETSEWFAKNRAYGWPGVLLADAAAPVIFARMFRRSL